MIDRIKMILKISWLEGRLYLSNHVISHIPIHAVRLFFYRRIMHYEIGSGSSIHLGAWTDTPRNMRLGNDSVIGQNCRLDSRGGLYIGNRVSISGDCIFLTADHDVQSLSFESRRRPIAIGDYAFVGTRATILPGVSIGVGAVIASGAVVTKDVPAYSIVAGVPAIKIGNRSRELDYRPLYKRLLH